MIREKVKFDEARCVFRHFWVSKVITTAHAHKSGVIFHNFPRPIKQKLRPKTIKIASRRGEGGGSCLNDVKAVRYKMEPEAFPSPWWVFTCFVSSCWGVDFLIVLDRKHWQKRIMLDWCKNVYKMTRYHRMEQSLFLPKEDPAKQLILACSKNFSVNLPDTFTKSTKDV